MAGEGGLLEAPGLALGGDWPGCEIVSPDAEAFIGCARLAAVIADDNADWGGGCRWLDADTGGWPLGNGDGMADEDSGTPALGLILAETACPTDGDSGCRWLTSHSVGFDTGGDVFAVMAGAGGDAGSSRALAGCMACLAEGALATDSACWPGWDAAIGSEADTVTPLELTGVPSWLADCALETVFA
ncbi:hypothetical protein [Thiorhodovibrio frisius]|uniref:hypothetical protein n=1 Tax=Thiorhodovibrio frisius TaxID=631362 RepID=UPI000255F90C|nr:hypothetical protein [Thiorhodovibrio frisius]